MVIDHPGFLKNLYKLMKHERKPVRRESVWIMSNLTAGTPHHTNQFLTSFPFIEELMSCIQNDHRDVRNLYFGNFFPIYRSK